MGVLTKLGCILTLQLSLLTLGMLSGPSTTLAQNDENTIDAIRSVASSPYLEGRPGVEITLKSTRPFPVVNAIAVLEIGSARFYLSHYDEEGDLNTLTFTLSQAEFDQATDGELVSLKYEPDSQGSWNFGPLDKSLLDQ